MFGSRQFDFMGTRKIWFGASLVLIVISLIALATIGLNLGIDFTGGMLLDLSFERPVTAAGIRAALEPFGLGGAMVQMAGEDARSVLVRTPPIDEPTRDRVFTGLEERLGRFDTVAVDVVSPIIGRELLDASLLALGLAAIGMIAYIAVRFEWRFGITGVLGLLHDVVIVLGASSLLRLDVSAPFVAAVLTVVGYSINATIVVYDRVRENLRDVRKEGLPGIVNRSIRQSLARCLNTSGTTLAALGAIYLFGGKTTQDFALALIIGIGVGTYSSIFLAAPLWCTWRERDERARQARRTQKAAVAKSR
jgi:preprotein translocase subunit SecF